MPEMMTVGEVALQLRVRREAVRAWLKCGRLPGKKIGKKWLVPKDAISKLLPAG